MQQEGKAKGIQLESECLVITHLSVRGDRGGKSLLLPMPHSPTSRTFVPLCLLTPALHCVAPIFFEVNQED